MNILEIIVEKFEKYPEARFEKTETSIRFLPNTHEEFEVSLNIFPKRYIVSYDGGHEVFIVENDALECFAFGLSENCRLKVLQRGNIRYKWILESKNDLDWRYDSEVGLLIFPYWLPKKELILQYHLIKDGK